MAPVVEAEIMRLPEQPEDGELDGLDVVEQLLLRATGEADELLIRLAIVAADV